MRDHRPQPITVNLVDETATSSVIIYYDLDSAISCGLAIRLRNDVQGGRVKHSTLASRANTICKSLGVTHGGVLSDSAR